VCNKERRREWEGSDTMGACREGGATAGNTGGWWSKSPVGNLSQSENSNAEITEDDVNKNRMIFQCARGPRTQAPIVSCCGRGREKKRRWRKAGLRNQENVRLCAVNTRNHLSQNTGGGGPSGEPRVSSGKINGGARCQGFVLFQKQELQKKTARGPPTPKRTSHKAEKGGTRDKPEPRCRTKKTKALCWVCPKQRRTICQQAGPTKRGEVRRRKERGRGR